MQDITALLKRYFGYDEFRSGQREIVEKILEGSDVLGIMPTGAGKSICYQIPSLVLGGVTVVVSPLISLMKDQVDALSQAGVNAAYVNSSLTAAQIYAVMEGARAGKYKIIYIAPERLEAEGFSDLLSTLDVSLIAVDEAHCVSQWGHDFRPSYTRIAETAAALPTRPVVAAFTATATPKVREDIVKLLELRDPYVLTTGFDRENLYFEVQKPKNKLSALLDFLSPRRESSGIIYASTRKTVDSLCERLKDDGYAATRYHAGLSESERTRNQEDFIFDRAGVMIATNAFGMGIDKSNISYVVHYNMPKNLESYYQEAGRAGRDGRKAECVLFYSAADIITNKFLIENSGDSGDKTGEYQKLNDMVDYCNTDRCLRGYVLRYFGEDASERCGNCGNCTSDVEKTDITVETQKILSCIKRMGERFGAGAVASVLRGSNTARIREQGFDRLSTYGIMKDYSSDVIKELISFMVADGYAALEGDRYPVLRLAPPALDVLRGKKQVFIRRVIAKQAPRAEAAADGALFVKLRALRSKLAQDENVPPYVVFSDATLADMCRRYPISGAAMLAVSGVGEVKLERYGDAFIELISDYVAENNIEVPSAPPSREEPRPAKPKQGPNSTQLETYGLHKSGLTVAEIAERRGLAVSTIEGHLLTCLLHGMDVDPSLFVTDETERLINEAIEKYGSAHVTPIKQALPEEIGYTAIRYVIYKNYRSNNPAAEDAYSISTKEREK